MKYFVILSCLLVTGYALPQEVIDMIKDTLITFGEDCKAETGTGDEDISLLKKHQLPATRAGKCFLACMHKKFGFQDAAGNIDPAGAFGSIDKLKPFDPELHSKIRQVAETCLSKDLSGPDECETAVNMVVCVHHENKAVGITPIEFD